MGGLCRDMDVDKSGTISKKEFAERIKSGRFCHYLSLLGVTVKDAELFFMMLSRTDFAESVEIDEFVDGCMRLRGAATNLDLQTVTMRTRLIHKKLCLSEK